MSSTVRETALDHISTAQPVAPLPAPEQGKALANGYGCDVFNEEARAFYGLERLWSDGHALDLTGVLTPDAAK